MKKSTIYREDAIDAVHKYFNDAINNELRRINKDGYDVFTDAKSVNALLYHNKMVSKVLSALPSAEVVSREDYHNLLMASNDIDRALREYQAKEESESAEATCATCADRAMCIMSGDGNWKACKDYREDDEVMTNPKEALEWYEKYPSGYSQTDTKTESDAYKRGFRDAKRAYEVELARETEAVDVYKEHEEEHLNIVNRIKELQYAIAKTQTIVGKLVESAEAEDRHYIKIYADDEPSVKAEKLYQICGETQNGEVVEWLKEYFPSAEPKTGEWISNHYGLWTCSECGLSVLVYAKGNYCPNCGTKITKGGAE